MEIAHQHLRDTVVKTRSRIAQLHERGESIGEQDTKATLIEPLLSALGWQLDELDDVRREYKRKPQDNPVDYALLIYGQPRLFIEAKSLGSTLDRKCASQVLGYASVIGVGWCLLTNGDEYRLYNSHVAVDVEEKLFRSVRLSDPEAEELCLDTLQLIAKERIGEAELDALWKSQFVDRRLESAIEELFSGEDAGLVRLLRKLSPKLTPAEIRDSLRRAAVQVHYPDVTASSTSAPPPDDTNRGHDDGGSGPIRHDVSLADLIVAGLLQAPLSLERSYKGVELTATVQPDGKVRWREEVYDSLSAAGGMARVSVIGAPEDRPYPPTNGWTFWQYRDGKTGRLRAVADLRQLYLQGGSK